MNLNELRCASAVAHFESFSAAAAHCFVTQPALSNAVARLERELGERIFVRTTRKVSLTPFGAHILPYLNGVLRAHSSLKEQARTFVKPVQGHIRIGVSPLIDARLLNAMIEPFRQQHPELAIALHEMNLTELERRLGNGSLDFVFEVEDWGKRSWKSLPIYHEPLLFIPRRGRPRKCPVGGSVRLKDIADETFVMVPDACGLARAIRGLFRSHRRKLKEYSGEGVSCQVLEEWVALGVGAAILPRSKLWSRGEQAFPIADDAGRSVEIVIAATWLQKDANAPHLAEFTEHMRRFAASN
ncbi:MAG: LysR family transcriptional regulator [Hyphomicrobiaceae bacterium]|nr:MAG: LysR family transcriptional regulator [Hyphomicrobiaceae bacterium]